MSQSEPTLGAFFIDIVAPFRTETPFRCLAELADRVFTLTDQHAVSDSPNAPPSIKTRYASIIYPVGNSDVEPFPIKAVLHQNAPAMQIQQVVVNFQTMTAECEGQPNLPIEPEYIEHAQEEIRPYLQDVWKRKRERERARQLQRDLAWRDFLGRLESHHILLFEAHSSGENSYHHRRCPLCKMRPASCTSCHVIMCLNRECPASQLVPFQSCSHHSSAAACLPCLENARSVPPLGQCPDCNLWFCQFEMTWCLGRPKGGPSMPSDLPNAAREHATRPISCSSCAGDQDRPHCSNGKCWSRLGGYTSVCESCSPGGGLWCTCEQCWICDDCKSSPPENCFKECPRCKRVYCIYECDYIQFCAGCGRATLCDDCDEEDWGASGLDVPEGVLLQGTCHSEQCTAKFCGPCLEGAGCTGCQKAFCRSCVQLHQCEACGGCFCFGCYCARKRRCGGCDADQKATLASG